MKDVHCINIQGAFYAFFDISPYIGKKTAEGVVIDSDSRLCEYLLEKQHVAVMPGSAYFADGYIRISFAAAMDDIEKALDRIEEVLKELK